MADHGPLVRVGFAGGLLRRWCRGIDQARLALVLDRTIEYTIYPLAFFLLPGKGEAFRSIGLYAPLAAWILKLCLVQQSRPKLSRTGAAYFLFIGSVLLSAFLSIDPPLALLGFRKTFLKSAIVFLVISQNFTTRESRRRLGWVLACSGCFFASAAFFNYLTGYTEGGGLTAFTASRNVFASLMGGLIPFMVAFTLIATSRFQQLLFGVFVFVSPAMMLLTLSRAGWISLLTSLGIWGIFLFRSRTRVLLRSAVAVCLVFLLTYLAFSQVIIRRLPGSSESWLSLKIRVEEIWTPILVAIGDRPVFGWGPSEVIAAHVYPTYFERIAGKQAPSRYPGIHSLYLSILFFGGMVGFTAYVIFVVTFLVGLLKRLRETVSRDERYLMIAVVSSFVAVFLVHGIVDGAYLLVAFGVITGFGEAFRRSRSGEEPEE